MNGTILYIEDNRINRDLVMRMLKKLELNILEANCGKDGIEIAEREHPDLILLDMNLPDIHGIEVRQRLKASPTLQHIPVVAVTAQASTGDRERFLAAGCDGYISKPVSRLELRQTVTDFLQ